MKGKNWKTGLEMMSKQLVYYPVKETKLGKILGAKILEKKLKMKSKDAWIYLLNAKAKLSKLKVQRLVKMRIVHHARMVLMVDWLKSNNNASTQDDNEDEVVILDDKTIRYLAKDILNFNKRRSHRMSTFQ